MLFAMEYYSPGLTEFVDMHIHSAHSSDGELEPRRIFELARESGARAIALSDHDSVAGIDEALELASRYEIEFIPSIELSTSLRDRNLHLLGPLIDHRGEALGRALELQRAARRQQARARIEALNRLGFEISLEEVERLLRPRVPTGTAIASILLKKSELLADPRLAPYRSADRPEIRFYQDYFDPGRPAYVPKKYLDIRQAIALVIQAGGVPILAHPGAKAFAADEQVISELIEHGLEGLEVFSTYHDRSMAQSFHEIALKHQLVVSAGSDFHGRLKPHVPFAAIRARGYDLVEELRERQAKRKH